MTAVKLLMIKLYGKNFKNYISNESLKAYYECKVMEKEQIIDAYGMGYLESENDTKGAYDYYDKTFTK